MTGMLPKVKGGEMGVVLVVDSEGSVAKGVADAFRGKGGFHAIIERRNGRSALSALLEDIAIDVIVSDDRLEDMDGIELLAAIRKMAPEMPVIMTSGHPSVDAYLKAVKAGVYDFIAQPVSPAVLRRIMIAAMEEKALSRHQNPNRPEGPEGAGRISDHLR